MKDNIALSELVAVRLCHDLSGSVGAVSNGIELFKDSDDVGLKDQAISLVEMSSKDAMAKIIFFRQAYGHSGLGDVAFSKIQEISNNFLERKNISAKWSVQENKDALNPDYSRLVLNIILMASNSVIGDGKMQIDIAGNDNLKLNASARMIKIAEECIACAKGGVDLKDIDVKNIQPYLINVLARKSGKELSITAKEDELEILLT